MTESLGLELIWHQGTSLELSWLTMNLLLWKTMAQDQTSVPSMMAKLLSISTACTSTLLVGSMFTTTATTTLDSVAVAEEMELYWREDGIMTSTLVLTVMKYYGWITSVTPQPMALQ